jgi:hypothetical protein
MLTFYLLGYQEASRPPVVVFELPAASSLGWGSPGHHQTVLRMLDEAVALVALCAD